MKTDGMVKVFCDGGARGNPGPAASAFVVEVSGKVVYTESKFLGKATNNAAEYGAVIAALSWLQKNFPNAEIEITLDSKLVASQMSGVFKIKNENLRNFFFAAKELEKKIDGKVVYKTVRRDQNKLADFLVNRELDGANENL